MGGHGGLDDRMVGCEEGHVQGPLPPPGLVYIGPLLDGIHDHLPHRGLGAVTQGRVGIRGHADRLGLGLGLGLGSALGLGSGAGT